MLNKLGGALNAAFLSGCVVVALAIGSAHADEMAPMAHMDMGQGAKPVQRVAAAPNTVQITNFSFQPKVLTVAPGTEVVWINEDEEPHTVTSDADPKIFKSPPMDAHDKFSFVFAQPGTYQYHCAVHPQMRATIIVK